MKRFIVIVFAVMVGGLAISCQKPDCDIEWGNALLYMPQANYNPYTVPAANSAVNYEVDRNAHLLKVFLGVYRSGLQPLESYTVNLYSTTNKIKGTLMLDPKYYFFPISVTCPDGARDATFCLEVNLDYLLQNKKKEFSIEIGIDSPSKYEIKEELSLTMVHINVPELIKKENL